MTTSNSYNGWKNYETWNVSLWLSNDEDLYHLVKGCKTWKQAQTRLIRTGYDRTPDGVSYQNKKLSGNELREFIKELQ